METGERVVRKVTAALEHDPRVEFHNHPIQVMFDPAGALVLEGELPNIAAKKLALEHAAAASGLSGVIDRLRITPTRSMSDGEIREHVRDALLQESAIAHYGLRLFDDAREEAHRESTAAPRCSIDVAVNDGVVTLDGQVTSLSHKRLVGALAWWAPGVRDVINGIEVSPEQEDSDAEITEAVKLVLEKDPLVNAERIRVVTHDATVTLEGLTPSAADRELAEMDAWYVFGVDQVINRIEYQRQR